jgi:DNA (cytosine-5)-methyltransferase 1
VSLALNPLPASTEHGLTTAGLFAGVGGLELGLKRTGFTTTLLCEFWEPAAATLRRRFRGVEVRGDIRDLEWLPSVDVVTAGFPCTDLSQVGRTAGIEGTQSGLVREVFRLVEKTPPSWLVLENVPNMLSLHAGSAMRAITWWLEEHGWNWAYRTVDSKHFGVPQRRRRVLLVASRAEDPRGVLFADEAGHRVLPVRARDYGFYWTEGNRGVGWAPGLVPTLKGGTTIGIPSPPAVWRPEKELGLRIVRPSIRAGERLQGFPVGWTEPGGPDGHRWKLIGNAVTVPVAEWLGARLAGPGSLVDVPRSAINGGRWPSAAAGISGHRERWHLSERPIGARRGSLHRVLESHSALPLSYGATKGFADRFRRSSLRERVAGFQAALDEHVVVLA